MRGWWRQGADHQGTGSLSLEDTEKRMLAPWPWACPIGQRLGGEGEVRNHILPPSTEHVKEPMSQAELLLVFRTL